MPHAVKNGVGLCAFKINAPSSVVVYPIFFRMSILEFLPKANFYIKINQIKMIGISYLI